MLPLAVIVILGLAAYRLTRLCTSDTITLPLRDSVFRWAYTTDQQAKEAWLVLHPESREIPSHVPRGWEIRTWVYELMTCDQCLGVWWGAAVYAAWVMRVDVNTDAVAAVIMVAAICGMQSVTAWIVDLVSKASSNLDA